MTLLLVTVLVLASFALGVLLQWCDLDGLLTWLLPEPPDFTRVHDDLAAVSARPDLCAVRVAEVLETGVAG